MSDELMHYGVPGMKWGVRKDIRSKVTQADSKFYSDKKAAKSNYKSGKKAATSRSEKQANKLTYTRAKNKAAGDFNKTIEKIAKKRGSSLVSSSGGSTSSAKVKSAARGTAGVLALIGGAAVSGMSKNPYVRIGSELIGALAGGKLMSDAYSDYASIKAYEGDTSHLRRKNGRGDIR